MWLTIVLNNIVCYVKMPFPSWRPNTLESYSLQSWTTKLFLLGAYGWEWPIQSPDTLWVPCRPWSWSTRPSSTGTKSGGSPVAFVLVPRSTAGLEVNPINENERNTFNKHFLLKMFSTKNYSNPENTIQSWKWPDRSFLLTHPVRVAIFQNTNFLTKIENWNSFWQ